MKSAPRRKRVVIASLAILLGVLVLGGSAGCNPIRTFAPPALEGSPAASGPATSPVVASEEWGLEVVPLAGRVEPAASGAYVGFYSPPAPFPLQRIDQFGTASGRPASIVMWYQPWARGNRLVFDSATSLAVMRRGAVPMITWEPWDPGDDANQLKNPAHQPQFRLSNITRGDFDPYIREWALDIRRLGGPVMLRPLHEMNGSWYPWAGTVNGNKPSDFVPAWRHIHDIFEKEGATNVTWVWSINGENVPNTLENGYGAYYPGDDYVDWTAISSFNWGLSDPQNLGWKTWSQSYVKPLEYLSTLNKPICIAEMACVEQGGDKAAWIADTYAQIQKRPHIKAVIYYDALEKQPTSTQDWRIDSTPASLDAYRTAIASPHYVDKAPAALTDWVAGLKMADWTYLSSLDPVY